MAFSKEFIAGNDLLSCPYLKIGVDKEALTLHFAFLPESEPGCFLLGLDGGHAYSRKKSSDATKVPSATRVVECAALIRDIDFLSSISKEPKAQRVFPVQKVDGNQRNFFLSFPPVFTKTVERYSSKEIPRDAEGIYCYKQKNTVIYIGRGNILKRLASPERQDWPFDKISFAAVDGEEAQIKWERYYLDKHIEMYGQKPAMNRINGFGVSDE